MAHNFCFPLRNLKNRAASMPARAVRFFTPLILRKGDGGLSEAMMGGYAHAFNCQEPCDD